MNNNYGCGKRLAYGQYWYVCGEVDMGPSLPALCTRCGGEFILDEDKHKYKKEYKKILKDYKKYSKQLLTETNKTEQRYYNQYKEMKNKIIFNTIFIG